MAKTPPQYGDPPAGSDAETNASQVANDEELLKILAGGAVDRILHEQQADLEGIVPALSQTADPTDQTLTPEELDALFGPEVDAAASDGGVAEDADGGPDAAMSPDELAALDEQPPSAADRTPRETPQPPAGGQLSQDDLDALFDPAAGAESPQPQTNDEQEADDAPLSQGDLDALFEQAASAERPEPLATDEREAEHGRHSQDDVDAILEQASGAKGPDLQTTDGPKAPGGPVSQDDLDALFEQAAGAEARARQKEEQGATEDGPVCQADLDALFAQATGAEGNPPGDGEDEPREQGGSPDPDSPDAPLEPQAATEAEPESIEADDLQALFAAAGGEGPSTPEQPPATDQDEPAEPTLTRQQLDDLLSQAGAKEATAAPGDAAELEAALDRQQAEYPDAEDATIDAAAAVSSAEHDALRASTGESSDPPVMNMADLDELLAGRAEKGAVQADLASDVYAEADDIAAPAAGAGAEIDDIDPTPPVPAAAKAPPLERAAGDQTIDQTTPPAREAPPEEATDEPDDEGTDLDVPLAVRLVCGVLDRLDEPFADLSPATKSALGYAGFALLFGALCLMVIALR